MKSKYYDEIIKLSQKSLKYDDVPVGAIIVKNGKIISRGFNKREKDKLTINHAEIIAIIIAKIIIFYMIVIFMLL